MRRATLTFALLLACSGDGQKKDAAAEDPMDAGGGAGGGTGGGRAGTGGSGGSAGAGGRGGTGGGGTGGSPADASAGGAGGARDAAASPDATAARDATPGDGGAVSGNPFVYISGSSSIIRVYEFDLATGTLRPRSMTPDGGNRPTYLAFHPNKRFLYAVNEAGSNSKILAFSIDQRTGALEKLNENAESLTAPGRGPPHLSVHRSGKWIFAPHFGSGHTTVHPIAANGGVGPKTFDHQTAPSQAHQAVPDPTGKFLFVPCRDPNYVAMYRVEEATGMLVPNDPPRAMAPMAGTGPRHMDFHPNRRWAYVLGEGNGAVIFFKFDSEKGLLTEPDVVSAAPQGMPERSAAHILVHPNGKLLYASLRTNNAIAIGAIDQDTGKVTIRGHERTMISGPRNFNIDPTGRYLVVANTMTNNAVVFEINQADGRLTMKSTTPTEGITQPQFVGFLNLP